MYIFRLAFDPRYAKASPGIVTNLAAIEAANAEGLSTVEFLGGQERYKLELADHIDVIEVGVGLAATRRGATAARAAVTYRELRSQLKSSDRLRRVYSKWIRMRRG
jgi:CelD/BcsL family acetyltransferase involved in cellulose biosynthesis